MADFSSLTFHIFTGKKIGGFLVELQKNIFEDYYFFDLFLLRLWHKNYPKLTSKIKNNFSDTIWVFKKAEICIYLKHGMHNRMQNRIEFSSF